MSWTDEYVGIPFVRKGRSPRGWDCIGLVIHVLRERAGVALPSYLIDSHASRAVQREIHAAETGGEWMPVEPGSERALDVVVMRAIHAGGYAADSHVGLVVGPGWLMHVEEATATVCLPFTHGTVAGRIRRIWRHGSLA